MFTLDHTNTRVRFPVGIPKRKDPPCQLRDALILLNSPNDLNVRIRKVGILSITFSQFVLVRSELEKTDAVQLDGDLTAVARLQQRRLAIQLQPTSRLAWEKG
jgi:hypothetical protein